MPAPITSLTVSNNIVQIMSKTNELVARTNTNEAAKAANSYVNSTFATVVSLASKASNSYVNSTFAELAGSEQITGSWAFKSDLIMNATTIRAANGSAAAPSIRNSSDLDTGIYFGTNTTKFSANGTPIAEFNANGQITYRYSHLLGRNVTTGDVLLELGTSRSGSGSATIDLVGDTTYTDYGLRIRRGASGANANTDIVHRGTGPVRINNPEAGSFEILTSGTRRVRIRSDGSIGFGGAGVIGQSLNLNKNITGNTTGYGIVSQGQVSSDVTSFVASYSSIGASENSVFTLPNYYHFFVDQGSWGAASTITTQAGFVVADMTKGTNRYGFIGSLAHGLNRYNLYMGGTARNFLLGNTAIGTNEFIRSGSYTLSVNGSVNITGSTYRNGTLQIPANLNSNNLFTKAQRVSVSALLDAPTITPDFNLSNHFYLNLKGNRTLANPTNLTAGQAGIIEVRQANTGSKNLTYGTAWKWEGNTSPTLSTAQNRSDWIHYYVANGSTVFASLRSGTIKREDNKLWFLGTFPYRLDLYGTQRVIGHAPYAGRIDNFIYRVGTGAITLSVRINGVVVTGLSALSVTTSKTTTAATAGNTFSVGDYIELIFSANVSTDEDLDWALECTRT
jgi:hypothetical protein